MKKLIYAKCPYCYSLFPWINYLLGEYPLSKTKQICKACSKESEITVEEIIKFKAKKIK